MNVEPHYLQDTVAVSRVQQRKSWYCGAACAEMFLRYYGLSCNQDEAYPEIHDEQRFSSEQLYSDPAGISHYLSGKVERIAPVPILEFSTEDRKLALDCIMHDLRFLKMPSLLLANHGDHWVVLSGIRYTEDPDGKKEVVGIYIENPWFQSTPSLYVSVEEFFARWLTPNRWGVRWKGKYVVVSDGNNKPLPGAFVRSEFRLTSASSAGLVPTPLSAVLDQGFRLVRDVAGGGGWPTDGILVKNTDDDSVFQIAQLDATNEPSFQDFVFVAFSGNQLLEMSSSSNVVLNAAIDAAERELSLIAPNRSIKIDPEWKWARSAGSVSRFDIFLDVDVNGIGFRYFTGGLVPRDRPSRNAGG